MKHGEDKTNWQTLNFGIVIRVLEPINEDICNYFLTFEHGLSTEKLNLAVDTCKEIKRYASNID